MQRKVEGMHNLSVMLEVMINLILIMMVMFIIMMMINLILIMLMMMKLTLLNLTLLNKKTIIPIFLSGWPKAPTGKRAGKGNLQSKNWSGLFLSSLIIILIDTGIIKLENGKILKRLWVSLFFGVNVYIHICLSDSCWNIWILGQIENRIWIPVKFGWKWDFEHLSNTFYL